MQALAHQSVYGSYQYKSAQGMRDRGRKFHSYKNKGGIRVCTQWGRSLRQGERYKSVCNRPEIFDRSLVELAVNNGVDILMKTRFIGMDDGKISVISNGEKKEISGDIIIGADGIQSSYTHL